jgi:molecular chaperone GrpE (heat shock protein)
MKNGIIIALILAALLMAIAIKVFNIGVSVEQKSKEDASSADKETLAAPAKEPEAEKPKVEEKKIEVKKEEVRIDNSPKIKELESELDMKKDSFMEMRSKKSNLEKVLASLDKKQIGDIDYIPELQRRASAIESRTVPAMEKLGLANKAFIDAKKELESASRMDKGFKSAGERIGWYRKGETRKDMRSGTVPKYLKGKVVYVYRGEVEAKNRFRKAQSEYEQCKEKLADIKAECKKLDDEYKLIKDRYAGRIKKDIEQIKEQMSDLKDEGDKLKEKIKGLGKE